MRPAIRLAAPAAAILWLNAYICRDLFQSGFTGHTHSMQGFWAALGRLATTGHWLSARWWPYHDAGSPFEWTYAPVVPALAALWSSIAGLEPLRGVQAVSGLVYCLGPVTLFLFCAVATRRILWSFGTAIAYSLLAPTEWVVPDGHSTLASIGDARRLYLMAVWDETPHYAALAVLPLVLLCVSRAIETRRLRWWLGASAFMALSLMTSAFGATMVAIGMVCLLLAIGNNGRLRHVAGTALCAAAAWALAAPSLPPSLIATIQTNARLHGDSGWDFGGFTALAIVIAGATAVLVLCDRCRAGWWPRFVWLFAWATTAIPFLFQYLGRHFLPQPGRYKIEAELGLTIAGALACSMIVARFPGRIQAALALIGLALAAEGVVRHRRYEKQIVREKNPAEMLEYRVARWASTNLPGARIALPGSLAMWFNTWADGQQFSGSSYSTAYNPVQQMAWWRWLSAATPAEAAQGLAWLKAFGTYAYAVPGPQSGEFWKALNQPALYLPCEALWHESDTPICRLPSAQRSLAHVLPAGRTVSRRPRNASDTGELRRYTSALDTAGAASFEWQGTDAAVIRAAVNPGEIVSVQISWHAGWQASANGHSAPVRPDGLGLSVIEPACAGPCEIRLTYTGGTEMLVCHLLRWTAVAALAAWLWRRRLA